LQRIFIMVSQKLCVLLLVCVVWLQLVIGQQIPVRVFQTARDTGDRLTEKATVYLQDKPIEAPGYVEGILWMDRG
jgi:hypothetical protein